MIDPHLEESMRTNGDYFVIGFLQVNNVPAVDNKMRCSPYLKAYLQTFKPYISANNRRGYELQRISPVLYTPKKNDCDNELSIVWNSYRNFHVSPGSSDFLTVELYHAEGFEADHQKIGYVNIDIAAELCTEEVKTFAFIHKHNKGLRCPDFTISLQRRFLHRPPPVLKTLFLVRHGESKWNVAQSNIDVGGMLRNRDHPLTLLGCKQAMEINNKWKLHQLSGDLVRKSSDTHLAAANLVDFDGLVLSHDCFETGAVIDFTSGRASLDANSTHATDNALPSDTETETRGLLLPLEDNWLPARVETDAHALHSPVAPAVAGLISFDDPLPAPTVGTNGKIDSTDGDSTAWVTHPRRTSSILMEGSERRNVLEDMQALSEFREFFSETSTCVRRPEQQSDSQHDPLFYSSTTNRHQLTAFKYLDPETAELRGRLQRQREQYIDKFMQADRAFCSPLTRAIETALLALQHHPSVAGSSSPGLMLYSTIRELKRIGGMDTVGQAFGDEAIRQRVSLELAGTVGHLLDVTQLLETHRLHTNDCNQLWWTLLHSYDSEQNQQERIKEFLTLARYGDAQLPIFVGHSLFFKAFYCKHISASLLRDRPELSENLKRFRLGNGTLLAVTVLFKDVGTFSALNGGPQETYAQAMHSDFDYEVVDADLPFGGGFHGDGYGHGDAASQLYSDSNADSFDEIEHLGMPEANDPDSARARVVGRDTSLRLKHFTLPSSLSTTLLDRLGTKHETDSDQHRPQSAAAASTHASRTTMPSIDMARLRESKEQLASRMRQFGSSFMRNFEKAPDNSK